MGKCSEYGYGRSCTTCGHWRPWSAYAKRPKGTGSINDRAGRCWHCDFAVRTGGALASTSKLSINLFRKGLLLAGMNVCSACGVVEDGRGFGSPTVCTFCNRATKFRNRCVTWRDGTALNGRHLRSLYASQGGRCAACSSRIEAGGKAGGHVHHDHDTMRVLDWLCHRCNIIEGLAIDGAHLLVLAGYMAANETGPPRRMAP